LDKSKKGSVDKHALSIIETINKLDNYYTTSSCSGRVYFWKGSGKKNETEWIRVSHDFIEESFLDLVEEINKTNKTKGINDINDTNDTIWLRYEGFIIHIACQDLDSAKSLLELARTFYKKSSILSISNKIIIEIRDSHTLEMPFYKNKELVFSGDKGWLKDIINEKLQNNWDKIELFNNALKNKK